VPRKTTVSRIPARIPATHDFGQEGVLCGAGVSTGIIL